ncbi:MAG: hypothetical protein JWO59_2983 [Chloroflexi bacterium]|jgi:hypothetical protein|nr:hypothetical protein [Chloroflexota bacterium]
MVEAVDCLLGCLEGDDSRARPARLEVFDAARDGFAPEVA